MAEVQPDGAVPVGRALQDGVEGPDLGQRYGQHALGGSGVDHHPGGAEAAVQEDLGEDAAGRVSHHYGRPVQSRDQLLKAGDDRRNGHGLDRAGSALRASTSTSNPGYDGAMTRKPLLS